MGQRRERLQSEPLKAAGGQEGGGVAAAASCGSANADGVSRLRGAWLPAVGRWCPREGRGGSSVVGRPPGEATPRGGPPLPPAHLLWHLGGFTQDSAILPCAVLIRIN